MVKSYTPSKSALLKAVQACVENAERLLEETYDLEFRKPPSSRFFLIMIAQEELAKAFILFLVRQDILRFSPPVLRAINDHACKQLVGMILDYMIMHWDDVEELKVAIRNDSDLGDKLPNDVGSAMLLLRYEKIGRWEANNWILAEDPMYDISALRIAKGKKDLRKQDALYVRIGRDGGVCSTPQLINEDETCDELERAKRYRDFLGSCLDGKASSHRYEKAMAALKLLFEGKTRSV
jgi:AbiV family abortive infection protein